MTLTSRSSLRGLYRSLRIFALVLYVDQVGVRGAESCVVLEQVCLAHFVRSHVSIERVTSSTACTAFPLSATASFSVPSLNLLLDVVLEVLLSNLCFLVLLLVRIDVAFRFLIKRHQKFEGFFDFGIFE